MVSSKEISARIKDFYRFSKPEVIGILASTFIFGIIFSFRDWGSRQFDLSLGLTNLFTIFLIVFVSLIFRLSCQKIYGLGQGYKPEFKVWWVGLLLSLIIAFASNGRLSIVLAGTVFATVLVKQRLGEFRYGFSYFNNAIIAFWGILGNLILATLFALGLYFDPESYFFYKGMVFNLIFAFCSLVPIPQLDGLAIFFGSRNLWFFGALIVVLATILLVSQAIFALTLVIVLSLIAALIFNLISSEK